MPRRAVLIGLLAVLCACVTALSGCQSNPGFNSWGPYSVVPPDRMTSAFSASPSVDSPGFLLAPEAQPSTTFIPASVTTTDPFSGETPSLADPTESHGTNIRTSATAPDLSRIYGRTAQADDRDRNPIIVIPGVLGSRLIDDQSGRVVWGEFGGNGINPSSSDGAQLIALPMQPNQPLSALTDGVTVDGTLDQLEVRFLGVPFQINAYRDLLTSLGVGGYHDSQTNLGNINYGDQGYSSFQFAYDWRRDNVENARRLHRFILDKKAYVESERQKRYGNNAPPVKFDLVAHSMGGLVARYYLQYGDTDLPTDGSIPNVTWAGAKYVDRLVMIAVPNAGSLEAVTNLVQGETLSRFLPRYEAAILGTMPALYQLLPRTRHRPIVLDGDRQPLDVMDPRLWRQLRWGLADPRQQAVLQELLPRVRDPQQRQQIAYDHLTKCLNRARAFHEAMDIAAKPPAGTTIHLIAGDAQPTAAQYRVDNHGALTVTAMQPGDGRVSRASALMDERHSRAVKWSPRLVSPVAWSSVNFLSADHLGLTRDPGFADNILFLLLEAPR